MKCLDYLLMSYAVATEAKLLDYFCSAPRKLGSDKTGSEFLIKCQSIYPCTDLCFQVYFAGLGCLKNVRAALCRGRALKCTRCGRPGATIGCRVDRCPKTYHLVCHFLL